MTFKNESFIPHAGDYKHKENLIQSEWLATRDGAVKGLREVRSGCLQTLLWAEGTGVQGWRTADLPG